MTNPINKEYFNLVVIGFNDDEIERDEKILPFERLFEYTTDEAKNFFKNNLDKIKDLDCIITNEGDDASLFLCRINRFAVEDGKKIIFSTSDLKKLDISFIQFYNENKNTIRRWEISRHHWAIKEGNTEEIINRTQKSIQSQVISENNIDLKNLPSSTEFPSTCEEREIEDIQGLIEILSKKVQVDSGRVVFYRGHSNEKYELEPSIFRQNKDGTYPYRDRENIIYHELLSLNYTEFIEDNSTFDRLVRMQHFSLPTRLLDITSNPLIALYFACKNSISSEDSVRGDLISIGVLSENVKYFNSDTVACLANLAKLRPDEIEKISHVFTQGNHDQQSYKNLKDKYLNYIRDDKPYFTDQIQEGDLDKIVCVKGKLTNSRIYAQSGAFLLFGLQTKLFSSNQNFEITHYKINSKNKNSILKQLDLLNINDSTVFPYLENSARYIANKFRK